MPEARGSSEAGTRQRLVDAGAELFRRRGYAATGVKAILAEANAPYSSLYHFFPGGTEDLGVAALRLGGSVYRELVEAFYRQGADVVSATQQFFDGAATVVEITDFSDACPIATVALEIANTSEPMRYAAAEAFESWLAVLEQRFGEAGIALARAHELAVELFWLIEGAFLLSRTARDTKPIHIAGRAATETVAAALAEAIAMTNRTDRKGGKPPGG